MTKCRSDDLALNAVVVAEVKHSCAGDRLRKAKTVRDLRMILFTIAFAVMGLAGASDSVVADTSFRGADPGGIAMLTAIQGRASPRSVGGTQARFLTANVWRSLSFEANQGQVDASVDYIAHSAGYAVSLTSTAMNLTLNTSPHANWTQMRMRLLGADPNSPKSGLSALPTRVNYYVGNDPAQWHSGIATYARVRYFGIYPGVDLVYHGNDERLEYDFIVAPGADPRAITLDFDGPERLAVNGSGDLELRSLDNSLLLRHKLDTYQEIGGTRKDIPSRFVLDGRHVRFEVAAYDRTRRLVIDPIVVRSVRWGGSASDAASAIATDKAGNVYVTGDTSSTDIPLVNPFRKKLRGSTDIFIAKFNASGSKLLYETYLGGSGADVGYGIAVDDAGNIYVTGDTNSPDFPLMKPWQSSPGGSADVFVAKLSSDGSKLIYSSYVGGSNGERGNGIAVDREGYAYVAGYTHSSDFPTVHPFQPAFAGGNADAFVFKVKPDGSGLVYSTYLGGGNDRPDIATAIATDQAGNAYVTGFTNSRDFPTAHPLQAFVGPTDVFVTKLNPDGSALVYSTFIGGSADDEAMAIAADASGSAYVTGETESPNFPTTPGAASTSCVAIDGHIPVGKICSGGDVFVSKLSVDGSSLVYSTFVNGTKFDVGRGVAVDSNGNAYVTGITGSADFPAVDAAQKTFGGGDYDAFVLKLNPLGSAIVYSTYIGGSANEGGYGIAVDGAGNVHIAGFTESPDFPARNLSPHAKVGGTDAFIATIPNDLEATPP